MKWSQRNTTTHGQHIRVVPSCFFLVFFFLSFYFWHFFFTFVTCDVFFFLCDYDWKRLNTRTIDFLKPNNKPPKITERMMWCFALCTLKEKGVVLCALATYAKDKRYQRERRKKAFDKQKQKTKHMRHYTPKRQRGLVVSLAKTPIVKVMNPFCG